MARIAKWGCDQIDCKYETVDRDKLQRVNVPGHKRRGEVCPKHFKEAGDVMLEFLDGAAEEDPGDGNG